MKILHTSDWHLGHTLYQDSQEDAQLDMLHQIEEIISEHQPDVLVIAGDVYDTTQPSSNVQQIFADAIVRMHNSCKDMAIVCIAGNHDSGSKHMIFHTPWKALNVHMIGSIVKDSDLNDYIVEIPGKGFVVAVPFAADRFMPENVFVALSEKIKERNKENLPVVLTTHLAVAKADYRGHENSDGMNIGGLDCQELNIFGDGYDYVALGHIHKQQALDKEKRIWYSGTPIAVSFDESYPGNEHGVLLAECDKHKDAVQVKSIQIDNIRPLVNIPDVGVAEWDDVKKMLISYDKTIPSFIRLNVEVENYLPASAIDDANLIINDKACRLCYISSKRKGDSLQMATVKTLTSTELKSIDFLDVAKMYIESKGLPFDDDMKEMLQEVKRMLN